MQWRYQARMARKEVCVILVFMLTLFFLAAILSGRASASASNGGMICGSISWLDQYGNMRPASWVQVIADDGVHSPITSSTTEGAYCMWVPPGTYTVSVSAIGFFVPTTAGVIVFSGGATRVDFTLDPSAYPIPEIPSGMQPIYFFFVMIIVAIPLHRVKPS